jgi:type II secretory pathway pseudopilin PulG
MPVIGLLLTLLVVVGAMFSLDQRQQSAALQEADLQAQAGSLWVYRNQVSLYAEANPAYSGVVPDGALALPQWYSKTPDLSNYLAGGRSYVYVSSPSPGLVSLLAQRSEAVTVGTNQGGLFYSVKSGNTGIALPAQIPRGAAVVLQ